jgi:drug/metabolite transporter (DMT)-like permease
MLNKPRLAAYDLLLYAIVVLSWGFAWISIRFQIGVVAADVSIMWRFLLAGAVILLIAALRGERLRYPLRLHATFALLGVLLFALNFLLFYLAAESLPSGLLSIVFSLASLINVWLSVLFFGTPVDKRVVIGGLLGAFGMTALFYPQFADAEIKSGAMLALLMAIAGTLAFCFGNMLSTRLQRERLPVFASTGYAMLYGAASVGLYAAVHGHAFIIEWTLPYIVALLYLSLISSVIAFTAYLILLGRIGAERAAYVSVLGPVVALTVSTFAENFHWGVMEVLGLVTVLAGNILVLRPAKKQA